MEHTSGVNWLSGSLAALVTTADEDILTWDDIADIPADDQIDEPIHSHHDTGPGKVHVVAFHNTKPGIVPLHTH